MGFFSQYVLKRFVCYCIIVLVIFMTTVYFVRHCEAEGNVLGVYQGLSDFDITDMGKKQLEFLSKRFENIHIDRVYSSPLIRAYKTAQAIAVPKGLEVITDNGLTEVGGGVIEGMKLTDIFKYYPDLEDRWCNAFHTFAPEKGESIAQAYERIWETSKKIIAENIGKTIIISTHGGSLRTLICRLTEGKLENIGNVAFSDNTAVSKFVFNDDFSHTTEFINDASHVPEEFMPKNSKITTKVETE